MTIVVHELKHPKYGSNFARQISASASKLVNGDGYETSTDTVVSGFWPLSGAKKTRKSRVYVGYVSDNEPQDEVDAVRNFEHRCGLLKITMVLGENAVTVFSALLEGHMASNFVANEVEFRFSTDDVKENEGNPVAHLWFSGKGKRYGPLSNYATSRIVCTFADKEQMDRFLDVSHHTRVPKSVRYKGKVYVASGGNGGMYQSNDGSCLPMFFLMYLLLSDNEQMAFAGQNPEMQGAVREMLPDTSVVDANSSVNDSPSNSDVGGDSVVVSDSDNGRSGGNDFTSGSDGGGGDGGGGGGGGGGD